MTLCFSVWEAEDHILLFSAVSPISNIAISALCLVCKCLLGKETVLLNGLLLKADLRSNDGTATY